MNFLIPQPITTRLWGNVEKKEGNPTFCHLRSLCKCTGLMFWNLSLGNTELILTKGSSGLVKIILQIHGGTKHCQALYSNSIIYQMG